MVRLGTARPGSGLRFDDPGQSAPAFHAVTNVVSVGSVAVRLSTTVRASPGTWSRPPSGTVHTSPAVTLPERPPVPSRVSKTRIGESGTKPVSVAASGAGGGGGAPGGAENRPSGSALPATMAAPSAPNQSLSKLA